MSPRGLLVRGAGAACVALAWTQVNSLVTSLLTTALGLYLFFFAVESSKPPAAPAVLRPDQPATLIHARSDAPRPEVLMELFAHNHGDASAVGDIVVRHQFVDQRTSTGTANPSPQNLLRRGAWTFSTHGSIRSQAIAFGSCLSLKRPHIEPGRTVCLWSRSRSECTVTHMACVVYNWVLGPLPHLAGVEAVANAVEGCGCSVLVCDPERFSACPAMLQHLSPPSRAALVIVYFGRRDQATEETLLKLGVCRVMGFNACVQWADEQEATVPESPETDPNAVAMLSFAPPELTHVVELSHGNCTAMVAGIAEELGLCAADRWLCPESCTELPELGTMLAVLWKGGSVAFGGWHAVADALAVQPTVLTGNVQLMSSIKAQLELHSNPFTSAAVSDVLHGEDHWSLSRRVLHRSVRHSMGGKVRVVLCCEQGPPELLQHLSCFFQTVLQGVQLREASGLCLLRAAHTSELVPMLHSKLRIDSTGQVLLGGSVVSAGFLQQHSASGGEAGAMTEDEAGEKWVNTGLKGTLVGAAVRLHP